MAEETIQIIRIETGEAVKSVNDLRENVKILKDRLGDLEIGTTEYQDTLEELKVNQAAVKDAMYATTASMEDLAKSATGASESYNSLVHRMASLKEELRATDVSTEQGKERFKELAGQINEVNDTLKEMDALQGNFQRNVGNYPGLMKTFSGSLDALDKGLKTAKLGVGDLKNGFDALAANPSFAILGIVFNIFSKLTDELKENESAMAGVRSVMTSLKPVMDFFKNVIQDLVTFIADLVSQIGSFLGSSGFFQKIVDGVVGVGNAVLKFVIAPFKGVIEAIKIFKEQGVKGIGDAARAFANEMKSGIAFKSNFQAGQAIVEGLKTGIKDKEEELKETAAEVGKEVGKELAYNVQKEFDKALAEGNKKFEDDLKARLDLQKELDAMTEEELARTNAEIEKYFQEQAVMRAMDEKDAETKAKAKIAAMQMVVDSTSSILSSLADLMEADEKGSEKNAKKIKALRIASTTIDTLSGAVSAFMSVWKSELPLTAKAITAPLTSASVLSAGMAQIAKMKSISETGAAPSSMSAIVSAPANQTNIPQVRNVTSASEEDRLNQMASDQRVVLVMSDLEVKQNQSKVQVAESSF